MFTNTLLPDGNPKKNGTQNIYSCFHRIACAYGGLIAAFCLFRCYLSIADALQDIYKFEHTGTFLYFLYYLGEYRFLEAVCTFLLVMAELLFYVVQYRQLEKKIPFRSRIVGFVVILIFHLGIWLHANSLPLPDFFPATVAEEAGMYYRFFANITVSPSVVYSILYLWHVRKLKSAT